MAKVLTLTPKDDFDIPVELDNIVPSQALLDQWDGGKIQVWHGNRQVPLNTLFDVKGDLEKTPGDQVIVSFALSDDCGRHLPAGCASVALGDAHVLRRSCARTRSPSAARA